MFVDAACALPSKGISCVHSDEAEGPPVKYPTDAPQNCEHHQRQGKYEKLSEPRGN